YLCSVYLLFVIFFFQAEDGIRDSSVTGVQTCALPIYGQPPVADPQPFSATAGGSTRRWVVFTPETTVTWDNFKLRGGEGDGRRRSEERRVGKEWRSRWAAEQ